MTGRTFDGHLTVLVKGRQWQKQHTPPLYVNLLDRGDHLLALPTDQSGGLRGGDRQTQSLTVTGGGALHWQPPAAALYYPGADAQTVCYLENKLQVEAGSRMQFCPRAGIPCRGARIHQVTEIHLDPGADFLFWDVWTTGRTAAGEAARFGEVANKLSLHRGGHLLFREQWSWRPQEGSPGELSRLGAASQWFLGLAQGPLAKQKLQAGLEWAQAHGAEAELSRLSDDVWAARFLSARAFDLGSFRA